MLHHTCISSHFSPKTMPNVRPKLKNLYRLITQFQKKNGATPVSGTLDSIRGWSSSMCYWGLIFWRGGVDGIISKNSPQIWYSPKRSPKNFIPPTKVRKCFIPPSIQKKKRKRILYNTMNYSQVQPSECLNYVDFGTKLAHPEV